MAEDDRESIAQAPQDTPPSTSTSSSSIWNTSSPAEAIQLALSQQKLFLVWISPATSDPAWDSIWTDPAIQSLLAEKAVSITLAQETTEAAMFLQLLSSPPTATGVWIVFSGQLLDSFSEPPSPEDMLQRINNTFSKSPNLQGPQATPSQLPPSTSTQPPSQAVPPEVQAQLAARRARLDAAKLQYGTPSPLQSIEQQLTDTCRQRRERTTSVSRSKASRIHRPGTPKIHLPNRQRKNPKETRKSQNPPRNRKR
jgi:hypothetical protein